MKVIELIYINQAIFEISYPIIRTEEGVLYFLCLENERIKNFEKIEAIRETNYFSIDTNITLNIGSLPICLFNINDNFVSKKRRLNADFFIGTIEELIHTGSELLNSNLGYNNKIAISSNFYIHAKTYKYANIINRKYADICRRINADNITIKLDEKDFFFTKPYNVIESTVENAFPFIDYLIDKVCGQHRLLTDFIFCYDSHIYIYCFRFNIFDLFEFTKRYMKPYIVYIEYIIIQYVDYNIGNPRYISLHRELINKQPDSDMAAWQTLRNLEIEYKSSTLGLPSYTSINDDNINTPFSDYLFESEIYEKCFS